MKIGILTFHWSTNYGAVLQTYALKKACEKYNTEVSVINYYPKHYKKRFVKIFLTRHLSVVKNRLIELPKEKNIEKFRAKYFNRTRYYESNAELRECLPQFDCYISGSDQIWNMSFTEFGEKKKTFTYFLDFVPDDKIIAAYAASFGTEKCKEDLRDDIADKLRRYDFISLRESTGVEIVKNLGIKQSSLVPDPTLLLKQEDYIKLTDDCVKKGKYAFLYILHNRKKDARELIKAAKDIDCKIISSTKEEVEEWLGNIRNAEIVITNSFHGVVFSIVFEVPFVALLIRGSGSGMNDRIITLLEKLGLEDRIYRGDTGIIQKPIEWENVREKLSLYRNCGYEYLDEILNVNKKKI